MRDEYQAWIDRDGRLLSLTNLVGPQQDANAERVALFEKGAVALAWNDDSVRLRYAPQCVESGALSGALRHIRTVPRPVDVVRWSGTDWIAARFGDGSAACEALTPAGGDRPSATVIRYPRPNTADR